MCERTTNRENFWSATELDVEWVGRFIFIGGVSLSDLTGSGVAPNLLMVRRFPSPHLMGFRDNIIPADHTSTWNSRIIS